MKKQVGLWIDHKEAFVVFNGEGAEAMRHIESGVEKHVRFSGRHTAEDGSADDQRDRQFASHLSKYYDKVIAQICEAESVFLFGPGEAKGELKKQLVARGLGERIVGVETTDKLTENQITAKVRLHYQL
ncbi:hypothetical protein [Armatimonas sp.]|uniref:hypothetical protein n=1 Tax=Armatimonas sp. TaxID=1872638 RepID=UPI0037536340